VSLWSKKYPLKYKKYRLKTDVAEKIKELIDEMKGFNNDPRVVDQRVKALVITKLEEALLWFSKINND
jgi:hypothetical protein